MIKLQRILHATDFSTQSQQALEYAKAFCERFDAELHAIHVVIQAAYPLEPGGYFVAPVAAEAADQARERSGEVLAELVDADWRRDHIYRPIVREGKEFVAIIEYAREANIDLIVLGTHGRSGLMQVLLGSVAEKVVRKAPCPVLTVRPEGQQFVMP